MPDQNEGEYGWGATAGGMALDSAQQIMKQVGDRMLRGTPGVTRLVLKRIPYGPGLVYDAAELATSKDRMRTGFGIAGALAGGALGGAVGSAGGPVGTGVGSVVGSAAGEQLAQQFYDDHRAQVAATERWIANRWAELGH